MKKSIFTALLLVGLLIAFSGTRAWGQYEDGGLIGTIHDATGAAVPNAAITVTNKNTGFELHLASNGQGDYEVPALRVGVYSIVASAPGFASSEAKNITVSVGNRQHIDLTLKVGQATSTVEVTDVSLQIETATSERGQTITNYQTESLPLVTRNYADLVGLVNGARQAPTAATTTAVTSLVRAGAYNVNGERSMFNNFMLDGMDNNAYGESNQGFDNQIIPMPPDSVAQFQVVTNNESAEYGRSSGALVNVASLSGTNRFHAKLYEFIRNTDLNAYGYIKPQSAQTGGTFYHVPKPDFKRNQFGADFGGPILHNHLFYFLDYEGFRQTLTPIVVLTVPTQNEINRTLVVDVQDPLTGTIYPHGTQIPLSAIDPAAQQVLNLWKNLPTQCQVAAGSPLINSSTGIATNDCATHAPFTDNSDKGDLRLDFQQSEKSSWFLRVSDRKETGINYRTLPGALDGQTNGRAKILNQQVALGYTRLFGTNKVLDARIGLSGTRAGKYTLSIGDTSVNIPNLPSNPIVAGGLPSTSISGGFSSFGRQSTNPQWQNPSLLDPKVNFSWVKGHHSLKFGYEYEHIWMEVQDSNPLFGSFTFSKGYSLCTSGSCTTNNGGKAAADNYWADYLFGTMNNYALATYFKAHLLQTMHNWYVQDDWKVNNKLTLNLGVRWEYGSPYSEVNNNLSNFDPSSVTLLTLTKGAVTTPFITPYSGSGTYGKTLVNPSLGDYAPRVGFAYSFNPKTVVRGGFGTSFVHYTRAGSGDILPINAPNALFVSVNEGVAPTSANWCKNVNAGTPSTSCFVTMGEGYPAGLATNFTPGTDNITYIPKDTKDSYVESWFLSVQRELKKNTIVDVAYVGNHGLKLQGFLNANQQNPSLGLANPSNPAQGFVRPYPTWGSTVGTTFTNGDITTALNEFYSHYDSLQVRFEQRFVNGLTVLNSFTWEHASDNASASLEGNTPSPQDANNLRAEYSQSDYNLPVSDILSANYELPIGHGKQFLSHSNGFLDAVVGNWQVNMVNVAQAGTPYNLVYTPNGANAVSPQISATYRGANEYRPNTVSGQVVHNCHDGHSCIKNITSSGTVQYVNWAAYSLPATKDGSGNLLSPFGNAGRNPDRTPGFFQTDIGLNKRFSTPNENLKVEFRSEFYNIFNHTNLYLPASGLSGTLGGTPSGGGAVSATFEPRIIQFGLKVIY